MVIAGLFTSLVSWVFRTVVIKFVVLSACVAVVTFLVPVVISKVGPFILPTSLTSAFSSVTPGMWFFLDVMGFNYGLPLVIAAMVSRFLIRRLPVIG